MSKGVESNGILHYPNSHSMETLIFPGKPLSAIAARRALQRPITERKVPAETLHTEAKEKLPLNVSSNQQRLYEAQTRPLKRKRDSNTITAKIRVTQPQPQSKKRVSKLVLGESSKKPVSNLKVLPTLKRSVAPASGESSIARDAGSQLSRYFEL